MSVLIKGITKPTDCILCPMLIGAWQMCGLLNREVYPKGTPKNCPMVELPPHGRLIDADALWDVAYKAWGTEYDPWVCNLFMEMINNAPTIIEAEEEKS